MSGSRASTAESSSAILPVVTTPVASEISFYLDNVMTPALKGLTPGTQAYANAEFQAHAQMLVYFSASPEFLSDVHITAANPASAQYWLQLN